VIKAISSSDYFFCHWVADFKKTESDSQESLKILAQVPIQRQGMRNDRLIMNEEKGTTSCDLF
jgi:hypothetical protein